jgi:mono/diheme cytochrome c family protein
MLACFGMRAPLLLLIGLFVAGVAGECLAQSPPAQQCPQPRFTGKAPEPYYSRKNPLPADRDLGAAEKLFKGEVQGKLGCAPCHGVGGGGDGVLASQFSPRPRNFRCAETIKDVPDGQLFWIIRFGSPGASMPAHKGFSDEQIWELVSYLRQLAK